MLTAVSALAPSTMSAQVRFSVSPYVGIHFHDDGALAFVRGGGEPESAIRVDAARFLGAKVGARFLERLWIEGDFGLASLDGDVEDAAGLEDAEVEGNVALYTVSLGVDLSPREKLSLIASLGVGGATTDFDLRDVDSFTDVVVTVGLGASYPLVPHVRLRGDLRSVVEFCDEPEKEEFAGCVEEASLTHGQASGGFRFDL